MSRRHQNQAAEEILRRKHHLEAQLAQTVSQLDQIHSDTLGQNKENSRNHGANIASIPNGKKKSKRNKQPPSARGSKTRKSKRDITPPVQPPVRRRSPPFVPTAVQSNVDNSRSNKGVKSNYQAMPFPPPYHQQQNYASTPGSGPPPSARVINEGHAQVNDHNMTGSSAEINQVNTTASNALPFPPR